MIWSPDPKTGPGGGAGPAPEQHRRSPSLGPERPVTPTGQQATGTVSSSGGNSTRPVSSPSLPSLLSLHQLGIAPLSPLRRQLSTQPSASSQRASGFWANAGRSSSRMEHTDDYGGDVRQSIEGGADADGSDNDEGSESIDDDDDDGDSIDVVTQDSKDVLVERLTDLLQRLTESTGDDTGGSKRRSLTRYDAAEISALHAKVDEMEHVLASRSASASSAATGGASAGSKRSRRRTRRPAVASDPFWAATVTTPPWLRTRFASEMSSGASSGVQPHVMSPVVVEDKHGEKHGDGADETTNREPEYVAGTVDALGLRTAPKPLATPSTEVSQLVRDAESLCAELSALVASLNARREESDHIHNLLIERAELAAQRIIELEDRVRELEDEAKDCDAEIKVLRIQLRAIEVTSMGYVPPDADPELHRSIENWKRDWAELKARRDRLRRNRVLSSASPESPAVPRKS